jgi:hypothetical protein
VERTWPNAAKLSLLSVCTLIVPPALPVDGAVWARTRTTRPLAPEALATEAAGAAQPLRTRSTVHAPMRGSDCIIEESEHTELGY